MSEHTLTCSTRRRHRWEELFGKLTASDTEFRISRDFTKFPGRPGLAIPVETFVLTPRGPVFVVPLLLPEPVGDTELTKTAVDRFHEVRRLFLSGFPDRKVLRVGMIRELLFRTGEAPHQHMLAREASFSGAGLVGGRCLLVFRDHKCNIRLDFEPVEIKKTERLPVGTTVEQSAGYGVRAQFDVNNFEIRPLGDADIDEVLERATSLWPDELLKYMNERSMP